MGDASQNEANTSQDQLVMTFDPNTVQHLGVQMYSTLPPVIAETVANSYDADAENVMISLNDVEEKQIIVKDNGHGMTFEDINSKFLLIGRDRRQRDGTDLSLTKKRPVIGRKGIGKLSFFGIANKITVRTVRDFKANVFCLDLEQLKASKGEYRPPVLARNQETDEKNGTVVTLSGLKRKTPFVVSDIAKSLARAFTVFDEPDFRVEIVHNGKDVTKVTNDLKYEGIPVKFKWKLPMQIHEVDETDDGPVAGEAKPVAYKYAPDIGGMVISSDEQTVPAAMRGIALFSRGKLVNDYSFYDVNATSHGYSYISGTLDISFIDKWDKDVISTNRRSLIWEDEDAAALKTYLNQLIRYIYNDQRKLREQSKKDVVKQITGLDVDKWTAALPKHESKLARKLVGAIVKSEGLDNQKAADMVTYVRDSFQFESFKELAAELEEIPQVPGEVLIQLLMEWKVIEAREFYKLSLVRVQTIERFEDYIKQNAKEVPTMHNFLKTFPWLLDPRIMEFEDEVYYSELLKEKYPESEEVLEQDRRIDFLCTTLADILFVIELKRPKHRVSEKDLIQANDYRTFVESLQGNEQTAVHSVVAYIVCGERNSERRVASLTESLSMTHRIFVKTYSELLSNAKKYHKEFIEKYRALQGSSKGES
jgi:hypothetical protein